MIRRLSAECYPFLYYKTYYIYRFISRSFWENDVVSILKYTLEISSQKFKQRTQRMTWKKICLNSEPLTSASLLLTSVVSQLSASILVRRQDEDELKLNGGLR